MQTEIIFISMKPEEIIEELVRLNTLTHLPVEELTAFADSFKYPHITHYLNSLLYTSKPETASAELLRHVVEDVLKVEGYSEVKLKLGFADFVIEERKIHPLVIELKPAFIRTENKNGKVAGIRSLPMDYEEHQTQVQKYLTTNDYLILTNLKEAHLFNREALVTYKPFYSISFIEMLNMYLENDCMWDNVRRLEDQHVKPDLEKAFFEDLTKWFEEFALVRFIENGSLSKNELIVLLINKIIFIKTLEDYGLIPYKFLDDEYFSKVTKWEFKGNFKLFNNFFTELEEWFWDYYDTELFRTKIWDFIEKDDENLHHFRDAFERVVGFGRWEYVFGKGLIHYNYRKIDEDVFGKAYERFIAKQRKDSGIYYTHRLITQYMAERLVQSLFGPLIKEIHEAIDRLDFTTALVKMEELYQIRVVDTASGSGSFLIKVFKEIYHCYISVYNKVAWANQEHHGMFDVPKHMTEALEFIKKTFLTNRRMLISKIILRHIYAIDIDERALETAKTNLWKEAVKIEKSLFKFTRLNHANNHILPTLTLNFHSFDSLRDLPIDQQIEFIASHFREEIGNLHTLRREYIDQPTQPELTEKIFDFEYPVKTALSKLDESIPNPSLICLKFFFLFFDNEGNPLPKEQQGFSGIISNPPWETLKPIKKEFAHQSKFTFNVLDFDKWFANKLKEDKTFQQKWEQYTAFYESYGEFLKDHYHYQDSGDLNYYKLFIERNLQLLQPGGYLNILVPSGIQTDKGCSELRKLLLLNNDLIELFSFENRGFFEKEGDRTKVKIFPDVDNRFKFSILLAQKIKPEENYVFNARFYLHDPKELYSDQFLKLDKEMIEKFSPENLSIMEFRSQHDYELCRKIRNGKDLLGDTAYSLRSEFHMTNDSRLFHHPENKPKDSFSLYEGKMIHQYNASFDGARYFLSEAEARNELLSKEFYRIRQETSLDVEKIEELFTQESCILDYQSYRLAYRAVASSTNERTLICSILPKNIFIGHSMNYLVNLSYKTCGTASFKQIQLDPGRMIYLMTLFNSLILNYYIRNKISANLTMNFIYELPIPEENEKVKQELIRKGFQLLVTKSDTTLFTDLAEELGITPDSETDEIEIRAEIEVLIARVLYGLTREEWEYLTSTFVFGDQSESKQELDRIIARSVELFAD